MRGAAGARGRRASGAREPPTGSCASAATATSPLIPRSPPPAAPLPHARSSFFQSLCVLGYCIFPLVLAALVCFLVANSIVRTITVLTALVWATRASVVFMSDLVDANKKLLAVYPVCLFYALIAWMAYMQ